MISLISLLGIASVPATLVPSSPDSARLSIDETIHRVESMVWDSHANSLVNAQGLNLVNVTWEDTGRTHGSVWGPNISDMTIGVRDSDGQLHPMPVMRFDNFSDTTADIRADRFHILTGNEHGEELEVTSLEEVLRNTREYLHRSSSWDGREDSLWAERDEHLLVSAQACFLPVPASGQATFAPVLYNYQSSPGAPAVATIVATSEGTSIQVVENASGYMSEVLFFNQDGERAPFTATRLTDYNRAQAASGGRQATEEDALDVVLVIQVPLRIERQHAWFGFGAGGGGIGSVDDMLMEAPMSAPPESAANRRSDVESAVIGHGEVEGPYLEINDLEIERDPDFPIRVTVQFYKATSNGIVSADDVREVREQIDRVYAEGDYVGSLVTQGHTSRPTEWSRQHSSPTWASHWGSWLKAR